MLILLADMLLVSTEQCKSGIFHVNPDKLDTKLNGYKIRTFENISPRGCFDKCIRRPRCHSYNYNRHLLRCELNYQPTSQYNFLNEVGFIYVEVDHYRGDPMYDTCLENPCKPGKICEETKDGSLFCVKDQEEIPEEGLLDFCNMTHGGWTVIQRRTDGSENFRRTWVEYENGFGDLQNEFWLGNKCLNLLTSSGSYKLRVELVTIYYHIYYAEYSTFSVGDVASRYTLTVNGYGGNAGNQMAYNNGFPFTTYDRDYDSNSGNCAVSYGAWWHQSCTYSGLNNDDSNNLFWYPNYYTKSYMKIQRTT
ncbi:Fibrinogen-like protein 1,Fibrinogen-like protein A,Tenascin,Ryncolin-2,Ryncolin-4,Tenascin-X,Ficolin-1-A,Angiopoietin-related protein 1,Ficolin-2,Ryncolin-1,Tenascin-R,Ficolin-3,Ryncolin-3,Ficolin-1 [Mytilus coruscus]|uniref:Uncharacterized protein n=1 Tax=Mytilus coruscus TaxID=42192 RepID=A0A6J8EM40_MYTCO|nr:Fibrinogen-like protein 1,Fibrinogen-like protein A,Tenascin,Ryncolin-2,Ryncolin-4,Tenascin-X,Ficolin-1-A,Angiopoietin-related protein 1,Ficolin-2,Ryncolin-1,Tenascin-R,Ficolin-3,Ryncolin-3,Ficolin-1 [Mytilus coruscus]